MSQMSLTPIELVDEQPADRTQSKDLLWVGLDEQDRRYALKTVEPGRPLLPLTEWLCHQICGAVGIVTPAYAIVKRLDGSEAFGSQWEVFAKQFSPARVHEPELMTWLARAQNDLCGMFALDAFMPNNDRHFGNILFVDVGPRLRALAFDWSRTEIFQPWPWRDDDASAKNWRWLKAHPHLVNMAAVASRLDRIKGLTANQVRGFLMAAPEAWRDNFDCEQQAQWWADNVVARADNALKLLQS